MKKIIILGLMFLGFQTGIYAQEIFNKKFKSNIVRHVVVSNFSGPIKVKKSNSANISVRVTQTGKELDSDVILSLIEREDYVMIYLKTPCSKPESQITFNPENPMNYQNWKSNCHWESKMEEAFSVLEFEIELPDNVNVYTQTMVNGDIEITDVSGDVYAQNINGNISLFRIQKLIKANTVNGNIDIEFINTPQRSAEISTINGEINIMTIENGGFNATFKSFQGDLYTNHDSVEVNPLKTKKETGNKGFKYTLTEVKSLKIGSGGPVIAVETFNGDAYLTKK